MGLKICFKKSYQCAPHLMIILCDVSLLYTKLHLRKIMMFAIFYYVSRLMITISVTSGCVYDVKK